MTETEFYIYEHDNPSCNAMQKGRAERADMEGFTTESTHPCHDCGEDLTYSRTITPSPLPSPPHSRAEFIYSLSDHERALLLGMAMESLRGSWSNPEGRLAVIGYICNTGVGDYLSDEFVEAVRSRAQSFWNNHQVQYLYADGRTFRGNGDGCYGKLWDEVEKDVEKMRPLATTLPNDLSWDAHRFSQLEAE